MKHLKQVIGLLLSLSMAMGTLAVSASESTDGTEANNTAAEAETEEELTGTDLLRKDYYEYVNGDLLSKTDIPATEAEWSWFYELSEDAYNVLIDALNEILDSKEEYEKGSDEQKIADFYLTFIDTDTRNSAGIGPFQEYLDEIQGASNIEEYMEAVGKLNGDTGYGSIIVLDEAVDSMDSTRYMEEFYSMNLDLGKEFLLDDSYDYLMPDYEQYIAALLPEAGYDEEEAAAYASEILSFMKEMAVYSLDTIDLSDPAVTYNVYTKEDLQSLFTNFDVTAYLAAGGFDTWDTYIVAQEELFEKVNEILTEDNLDLLKAYSSFCTVNHIVSFISTQANDAYMKLYMDITGVSEEPDLERLAAEATQSVFEFEFGKLYVERCFTEDDKQTVTAMTESLTDYYRERIWDLDWLSDESKQEAVKKLDTMNIKVGYPDVWPDYFESTDIRGPEDNGSLIENCYNLICSQQSRWMELVHQPVDRSQWDVTPQTVNAFYSRSRNSITFPAAILQEPFYSSEQSEAENYGGIGTIIAHEITHAFDAIGSNYDEVGNYNPWWTEKDAEKFEELTQQVIDYYDTFEIAGRTVNGEQTVNENIAELGSLHTVTSYFEDDTEALDELFRQYALIRASKYTDEYLNYLLVIDEHVPNSVRVNSVLMTLDCFYDTYPEIQEGDGMYLAPEDRVQIW